MAIAVVGSTRTSTGNFTNLNLLAHLSFRETAGATARFTVREGGASGTVICSRTLAANESDDIDYANPYKASDATPVFHLTVDSGAVSVTALSG